MKRVNYMVGKPNPGTDHAKGRDSGASPAGAGSFVCCAGRHLVMEFDEPSMEAVRSAIELPTELKWKVRPGYSASSMPCAEALLTVPSMVSTGALK